MKRVLFLVGLIAGIALGSHRADATTCTVPNIFVNGTAADANAVNANFSSLQTCGNSIDHNNIGPGGIYATQMIPTTVGQAIFGGSVAYQFSNGLIVLGGLSADTLTLTTPLAQAQGGTGTATPALNVTLPLQTTGAWAAQTLSCPNCAVKNADNLFSVHQTSTGYLDAGNTGLTLFGGDLGAGRSTTTGALALGGSTEAGTLDYNISNSHTFSFTCVGTGCGTKVAAGGSFLPPVYTTSGGAVASTAHIVTGAITVVCPASGACVTSTVTLSGSGVFTSSTSYSCSVSVDNVGTTTSALAAQFTAVNLSGTQFKLSSPSTLYSASDTYSLAYSCVGT